MFQSWPWKEGVLESGLQEGFGEGTHLVMKTLTRDKQQFVFVGNLSPEILYRAHREIFLPFGIV